jgi:hypothetical protein
LKPVHFKRISAWHQRILDELHEVKTKKDEQLKEAYSCFSTQKINKWIKFEEDIVNACAQCGKTMAKARKPRKKKGPNVSKIIGNLEHQLQNSEFGISSVPAEKIFGANQVWLFNTKYRTLTKLVAETPDGLEIKGKSVRGFSPELSIAKKLRKAKESLIVVQNAGKVQLKKIMNELKTKPSKVTGQIGKDTIIFRVL